MIIKVELLILSINNGVLWVKWGFEVLLVKCFSDQEREGFLISRWSFLRSSWVFLRAKLISFQDLGGFWLDSTLFYDLNHTFCFFARGFYFSIDHTFSFSSRLFKDFISIRYLVFNFDTPLLSKSLTHPKNPTPLYTLQPLFNKIYIYILPNKKVTELLGVGGSGAVVGVSVFIYILQND